MADEEEPQSEESDYEIPGIPDESRSTTITATKTESKMSKLQSLVSTIMQNGSPSGSQVVQPLEERAAPSKTPSAVPSKTPSSAPSKTSSVPSKQISQEPSEEAEEFQEESKSQDLSLKKSSLDQLSKEMSQLSQKPRLHRHCHRRFRELIGKREMKKEELTKQQCVLKQRLDILECSMPAVMVWNIWRMSQGACVPNLKQVLEKQFQGPASGEVYCPSTPSRHFDCRVREVEAERKLAQKRVEEARALWAEKEAALEEKTKRLEEAKKTQVQIKENIENLKLEAQRLREAASKATEDGACEAGECRVIECKKKWLEKVPSGASIKSTDIECLEELQHLAQSELSMKRQIAELERREEAYMRTLQQADELWAKLQCDATSTMSTLQDQLDVKTAANQQMADRIVQLEDVLEDLRSRLATCRSHLEKFMSIDKIEALIGRDSDFAGVFDRDTLAKPDMDDAESEIKPDVGDAALSISPEDFELEKQRAEEAMDYLASYGSLSELFVDDDYVCAPDFVCNDVVLTETGLTEEEMTALKEGRVTAQMLLQKIQPEMVISAVSERTIKRSVKDLADEEEGDWDADEMTLESERIEDEQIMISELDAAESLAEPSVAESLAEAEESVAESLAEAEEPFVAKESFVDAEEPSVAAESVAEPSVEASAFEGEFVEHSIKTEPEDYVSADEEANILVPLDELVTWQDNVDTIRETIAKCPDCVVVKNNADVMAEEIARYTGREVRQIIEEEKTITEAVIGEIPLEEVSIKEEEIGGFIEEPSKEVEVEAPPIVTDVSKEPDIPLVSEAIPSAEDEVRLTEEVTPPSAEAPVAEEVKKADVESIADIPGIAKEKPIEAEVPKETEAVSPVEVDKVTPLAEPTVIEQVPEAEKREDITKEKEVGEMITEERKEEADSQILAEKVGEAVTAERKEIEGDLLPEKEPTKETVEVVLEGREAETAVLAEEEKIIAEERIVVAAPEAGEMIEEVLVETREEIVVEEAVIEEEEVAGREEEVAEREEEVAEREEEEVAEREEEAVAEKEEEAAEAIEEEEAMEAIEKKEEEAAEAIEEEEAMEAIEEKEEEEVVEAVEEKEEEEVVEAVEEKEEVAVEVVAEEEEVAVEIVEEAEEEAVEAVKEEEEAIESVPEEIEEEAVMEPVPEEEEVEAPSEEKEPEEPTEVPTDEVEKVVILSVEVLPEAEKEVEEEEEMIPEAILPEEVEVEMIPEEEPIAVCELEVTIEVQVEEVCVLERPEEAVSEESVPEVCVCEPLEESEAEALFPDDTFRLPCVCSDIEKPEVPKVETVEVPCVCCEAEPPSQETKATVTEDICELPCTCFAPPKVSDDTCICSGKEKEMSQSDVCKLSSVRSYRSGISKAISSDVCELPCSHSLKSGISKAVGSEMLPGGQSLKSGISKATGSEMSKVPCSHSLKSGTSRMSEEPRKATCVCSSIPEESTPEQSKPCACKPESEIAGVEAEVPMMYSISVVGGQPHEPSTKIEVTQTELTRTFDTMQVVTQTVSDTGTQTPVNRLLRRSQQPKIIAVTGPVDPEMEVLSHLSQRLKPITQTLMTTTASSQTEKVYQSTSVSRKASPSLRISEILQSLRTGVAHLKSSPEEELKSINYRKPQEPFGKCNCCVCGKDMSDPRTRASTASSVFRFPRKNAIPGVDQAVQYDTMCPKCKITKLQETLRSRESLRHKKEPSTCDRQVHASVASFTPKGIPFNRLKKKVDQGVTAKIPKSGRKPSKKNPAKEVKEILPAKPADKESVMHCMCEVEDDVCGTTERTRCACGDPD